VNLQTAADRHLRRGGTSYGGRLEVIIGDVRDRTMLRKALRDVKYVFHLAAVPPDAVTMADPSEIHSVNVEGTLSVLQGALTEGVWRVVLASCASVYGMPDAVPVTEDAQLRPFSFFGASKVAAETYCRAFHARHQLETVALRYFTIYGPRQRAMPGSAVTPNLIEALRQGRVLVDVDGRSVEDFMYVSDAVAATLAAGRAPRAAGRVINVASGQMVRIADVQQILASVLRTTVRVGAERSPEAPVYRICAATGLATELLDVAPRVSLASGLAEVVRSVIHAEDPEGVFAPVGLDE
jgi:UDP-glucose 4-epimerase